MAFFRLVLYASKLDRIAQKVKAEKEAATALARKEKPKYGWRLKLSHLWINLKRRLSNCLINSYFLKNTAFDRFFYRLRKYGSLENYILKSILGFVGGYVLTYLLFMFLAIQLNVRLSVATVICCFVGCILTIGLAFSQSIRCIVFLILPQFFSKKGRQALIAYALILTMTGPAKNTLNNMGIMSESMACGQEQLKSAVRQIMDVIKKPFLAIKEAIKSVVKAIKEVIKKIKDILMKIKRVIMSILAVIKSAFEFLGRILNLCNKELGTPFQRCSRVFETAIADCQASLGPFFSWACSIGYLLNTVCYIVKPFDLICLLVDFISNSIIGVVMRKMKIFIRHVKTMFYVRIKFSHSFHFESKSSKSMRDVARSIMGEVKMRTRGIVAFFEFFNCAASVFFIFLIYRVVYYRHKFLTKERFDNKFLTQNLVDIDLRRAQMEKETIFPLNHRERKKFITIKSVRLLPKERKQLTEALSILLSTSLKIGTHMAIDYCVFWIMNLIRKYGKFQSKVQAPNIPTVHIAGEGLLADLLKAVVKSFQPIGISLEIDTVPCLPIPIPPDFDRYVQIGSILFLCLLLTIFEPYGLRWRQWILCYYYPRRAKERAVWLYNHILRSRSSFLKFARRQLRRKLIGNGKISKVTCLEYLRSRTNNKCLLLFLGSDKQQACLFCGEVFRKSDNEAPIRCQRPGCTAMYCRQCFEDLENVCTACLSPIEYGDTSDFSEERDSSDEDYPILPKSPIDTEGFDSGVTAEETSEGSTDEYSYSYQESEKLPSVMSDYKMSSSRDVEKQSLPDYVSMQYFEDEIELYSLKPYGFEERDEETQFPAESSSSEMLKSSVEDPTQSSHVASSIDENIEGNRARKNESCTCLDLNTMDDPPHVLLLDELKLKLSSVGSVKINPEYPGSSSGRDLRPIQEQTEDEALIQFSTDEEREVKSTIFEGSQESFTARSHLAESGLHQSSIVPKENEEKLLSDSELSENDVERLIGKPETKRNPSVPTFSSPEETSNNDEVENDSTEVQSASLPNSRKITADDDESANRTQVDPVIKEEKTSSKKQSGTSQDAKTRHIEFIGIQKKKKKKAEIPTESSSDDEKPSTKRSARKYRSTISTKTSKQDIPIEMKERKSILKVDSTSSVLTEIKELQEPSAVPKLNLKLLESESQTVSRSDRSKNHSTDSSSPSPRTGRRKISKKEASSEIRGGKSISEVDSNSSVLSEIKELQGTAVVPKLNLKLLESESQTVSPRDRSKHQRTTREKTTKQDVSSGEEKRKPTSEVESTSSPSEIKELEKTAVVPKLNLEVLDNEDQTVTPRDRSKNRKIPKGKTTKHDVLSGTKKKKPISEDVTTSSVLSEIKELKETPVVPKLNLKQLNNESQTVSPRDRPKYRKFPKGKNTKQDVSSGMKKKKPISEDESTSSVLSEIKELKGTAVVPKLNLKLLNSESQTVSPRARSKGHRVVSSGSSPKTAKKNTSSRMKRYRKTDRTEKRLKAGSTIPTSSLGQQKFLQDSPEAVEASFWQPSGSQDFSSPIYPFRSSFSTLSSLLEQHKKPHRSRDLYYFESSDSSFSNLHEGRKIEETNTSRENVKGLDAASMTSEVTATQPSRENSNSIIKSAHSVTTKKSVRISEDTERTSDEDLGETDASSDLSISVQENILGIPRNKSGKREKIDWSKERELSSQLAEDSEENFEDKVEKGGNQIEEKEETRRHSNVETSNSNEKTPEDSGHEPNNHMEQSEDDRHNLDSEKFLMQENDSRLSENRRGRNCRCCKCKSKLPITHHSPGGDPERRILLQTGVDSYTQTSIDRSDRSSQIDFGFKAPRESFQGVCSNKSCSVRCRHREETVNSSFVQKPEKHCLCSACMLRKNEDTPIPPKDSFCDNPCLRESNTPQVHKKCTIPRRKTIGTSCKPLTRDQVCLTKKPYGRTEEVYPCEALPRHESTESVDSNVESYRDRIDLPYQDNDEYRRLVRELEEKLVARNRERVRKTMREFEKCSTRNQNLRKPILYDDSSCGEEPILTKIVHLKSGDSGKSSDRRKVSLVSPKRTITSKEVNTEETMQKEVEPQAHRVPPRPPRYYYDKDATHWQMDKTTGEWFRVSDVNICDPYEAYEVESRYSPPVEVSRRRMMERFEEEPRCEDCDDLNRRYGHRYNILFCPRHRLDRFPPRHRRR